MAPMSGFFEELKRRKVYRVAVAYVIAGGGLIQLASAVFPAWELPNWTLRLTVMLLLFGFPLALVLAWAFDVTPEGIRTTPAVATTGAQRHRRRNVFLLIGAGVIVSAVAGFFLLPRAEARVEKSIAVLPFENFSTNPENAHFADGIQDDILTNLAKIGDLKVISRTSVMGYRGNTKNVREIGKALDVGAVLEGSVRRDGNRVRVSVQLIDTENDRHLWAEDYDRELTDVFALQTDLAQNIARELHAQLSPTERALVTKKPTENGEAYLAFVEANNLHAQLDNAEKLRQAQQLYERALELDPKFARAEANLSTLQSWFYHSSDPTEPRREAARRHAERALQLEPDCPEAHFARGYYLYYGERDFDAALQEFAIAQEGLPNDDQVYLLIGAIQRRQGRWAESTANMEKAVTLNPKDAWTLQNLAFNYQMTRNFEAAQRTVDRGLAIDPKSFSLWEIKSKLAIGERGDFSVVENAFAQLPTTAAAPSPPSEAAFKFALARADVFILQRKYAEARDALAAVKVDNSAEAPDAPLHRNKFHLLRGIAELGLGHEEAARAAFLVAKEAGAAAVRVAPGEASRHADLARALALLGEKEAAIAEAKRAMELLPETVDAFEGPAMTTTMAFVYALVGEKAEAIKLFDGLLNRPSGVTVALLRLDPALDGLRDEPAFQEMVAKHSG